jgi:hypothetical protein
MAAAWSRFVSAEFHVLKVGCLPPPQTVWHVQRERLRGIPDSRQTTSRFCSGAPGKCALQGTCVAESGPRAGVDRDGFVVPAQGLGFRV